MEDELCCSRGVLKHASHGGTRLYSGRQTLGEVLQLKQASGGIFFQEHSSDEMIYFTRQALRLLVNFAPNLEQAERVHVLAVLDDVARDARHERGAQEA